MQNIYIKLTYFKLKTMPATQINNNIINKEKKNIIQGKEIHLMSGSISKSKQLQNLLR